MVMPRYSKGDSLFNTDKQALIEFVLDKYDVTYNPTREGWQKVRCLNEYGHTSGDKNPSASVNTGYGYYHCFACGISGDGYEILRELENWGVKQVNEAFGGEIISTDERGTWL